MCAPSVQPGLTSLLARVPAPPRPGLTLLTLQRAVYLCMAVPRQAGV